MIQKPKISLLLLIDDNFDIVKRCVESFGLKYVKKEKIFTHDHLDEKIKDEWIYTIDGIEVELLYSILGNSATDDIQFPLPIFPKAFNPNKEVNKAIEYNYLFKEATGTHICILQPYTLLNEGWLLELLSYSQMVAACGMVCLANTLDGKTMQSVTDKDFNFINVFISPEDKVDGVCLFDKEYLNYIGAMYDEKNLHGLELNHYAHRSTALGLNNFYIPNKFGIEIVKKKEVPVEGYQNYDLSVEYMSEIKNWYYKL